jgi:diacylglycerol kinase family enzyme
MHLYIYDIFLNNQKYSQTLQKIEARLNDLDIKGRVCRLNLLKNVKEIIDDGVAGGVTTIVAVGNDSTFSKIINYAIQHENIVIGYIPIEKNSKIADIFGLPTNEKACDIIAQRIIKKIDLGKINNMYFLDSAKVENEKVKIKFNDFEITPLEHNIVSFCNLGALVDNQNHLCNPSDGYLEAIITPIKKSWFFSGKKAKNQSIFPFTKIKVLAVNDQASIRVDDQNIVKTPADIEILPKKLKVITSSDRKFE